MQETNWEKVVAYNLSDCPFTEKGLEGCGK